MSWSDPFEGAATEVGPDESIELVGTNLRMLGTINLHRFGRLTDLINASSGYIRVRDARLLQRNGEPTDLVLPELMVDQDEVSFIAQREAVAPEAGAATGFIEPTFGATVEARSAREFVMFTPGHMLSGRVYLFGQTDLAAFVDSTDPRFVPVVDVTARSLADRRIVTRYDFVLVNRTQLIAAAETGPQGDVSVDDLPDLEA